MFKKTNIRFQILSRNISIRNSNDATENVKWIEEKDKKKHKKLINFLFTTPNELFKTLN